MRNIVDIIRDNPEEIRMPRQPKLVVRPKPQASIVVTFKSNPVQVAIIYDNYKAAEKQFDMLHKSFVSKTPKDHVKFNEWSSRTFILAGAANTLVISVSDLTAVMLHNVAAQNNMDMTPPPQ